jgi:hypothetical protein
MLRQRSELTMSRRNYMVYLGFHGIPCLAYLVHSPCGGPFSKITVVGDSMIFYEATLRPFPAAWAPRLRNMSGCAFAPTTRLS